MVITIAGRQDLLDTLAREEVFAEERFDPAPVARKEEVKLRPRRRIRVPSLSAGMLVAAVLCGILGWLAYDTFGTRSPDQLTDRYFEPYPNIFETTPPQTDDERDLERILYYYDRADYRTAYEELLPTAPAYPAAPLYLGVSALALDDPLRAREWFAEVDAEGNYRMAADWYDALSLLALDRREAGIAAVERIANTSGHPFREAAREVLADF